LDSLFVFPIKAGVEVFAGESFGREFGGDRHGVVTRGAEDDRGSRAAGCEGFCQ
jgi:hypothetical protein